MQRKHLAFEHRRKQKTLKLKLAILIKIRWIQGGISYDSTKPDGTPRNFGVSNEFGMEHRARSVKDYL